MYIYTFFSTYRSAGVAVNHPIPLEIGQDISLDFPTEKMSDIYTVKRIRPGFSSGGVVDFYVEVE